MDSNDRRSRQNNPSGYASTQSLIQSSSQYPAVSAAGDRFRHQHLTGQSPTSAPSTARTSGLQGYSYPYGAAEGSHFTASSMQATPLQYQAEYGQESQRPAQSYQYGQNIAGLYSVSAQPQQQQQTQQSPYESAQSYQPPRQTAAIEVLSTQFGVPQQYYVPGEGPTSTPGAALATQNVQAQYNPLSYASQNSVGRESIASGYGAGLAQAQQPQEAYGQAAYPAQTAAQAAELDVAYGQYQQELRRTFESVRDGRLTDAGPSLLHISEWLLGNAEALVRDDESMHGERIKLWEDFNYCWLSTLQRQKDITLDLIENGLQRPHPPNSLLDSDFLESMGKELIRLCDIMEKHGLVDYQLGVWEEEIINLLTICLDLLADSGIVPSNTSNTQDVSNYTQRRR